MLRAGQKSKSSKVDPSQHLLNNKADAKRYHFEDIRQSDPKQSNQSVTNARVQRITVVEQSGTSVLEEIATNSLVSVANDLRVKHKYTIDY